MKRSASIVFAGLIALHARAAEVRDSEEFRIGTMVIEVSSALKHPADPKSLETITRHGTDSRHYVMIRGWLVQELKGTESQHAANRKPARKAELQIQIDFLKRAIRRIDLE